MEFNFSLMVFNTEVPILAYMDDEGRAFEVESAHDDELELFNCFQNFTWKVRRKDHNGNNREHDARMCFSNVKNDNAEFRIEMADVYIPFINIAYAAAYIANKKDLSEIDFNHAEVIAYAISNL